MEVARMTAWISREVTAGVIGTMLLLASPLAGRVAAQERPGPVVEFTVAWMGFPDDGLVSESVGGGAGRFYVSPRISLGPEVAFIQGDNHSHLMATGNITVDLLSPVAGSRARRVTPFVVVGGGLFQTRSRFSTGTFSSNEGAFTAGVGVRALVGDRVTVGVDTRIGWEPHIRVSGVVGIRLK
jgi:hypothetical protein